MNHWRVTKYNPKYRENGTDSPFSIDTWTQVEDLQNGAVSLDEYLKFESLYTNACLSFAQESELKTLNVVDFINNISSDNFLNKYGLGIKDERRFLNIIDLGDLADIVKKNLRGIIYCKLEVKNSFYIHFGYDFYMYIGSTLPCIESIKEVTKSGLFVEEFVSPYLISEKNRGQA